MLVLLLKQRLTGIEAETIKLMIALNFSRSSKLLMITQEKKDRKEKLEIIKEEIENKEKENIPKVLIEVEVLSYLIVHQEIHSSNNSQRKIFKRLINKVLESI